MCNVQQKQKCAAMVKQVGKLLRKGKHYIHIAEWSQYRLPPCFRLPYLELDRNKQRFLAYAAMGYEAMYLSRDYLLGKGLGNKATDVMKSLYKSMVQLLLE